MNEVSADHASMYHTGISGVRTSVRLPRYVTELLPSSIWFDVYVLCGSVTVPSITGIFDQMLYYIQGDTLYTY